MQLLVCGVLKIIQPIHITVSIKPTPAAKQEGKVKVARKESKWQFV
jgi:hypothetical protein